jgi:hypothetical protein
MVVSENMSNFIAIKLNKQVACEIICSKIQKLINDYQKTNNISDSILTIKITNPLGSHIIHKPLGLPLVQNNE